MTWKLSSVDLITEISNTGNTRVFNAMHKLSSINILNLNKLSCAIYTNMDIGSLHTTLDNSNLDMDKVVLLKFTDRNLNKKC